MIIIYNETGCLSDIVEEAPAHTAFTIDKL